MLFFVFWAIVKVPSQKQETDEIIAQAHASLTRTLGGASEATFWTIFLLALALSQQKERSWSQHFSAMPRTKLKVKLHKQKNSKNIEENIEQKIRTWLTQINLGKIKRKS